MSSCHGTSRQNQLRLRLLTLNDFELPSISPPCTPIAKTPTPVFRKGPNDARIYQPDGHPKQCVIDGEIWPPVFVPENVRSAKAMQPRSDDVFICTYPKCGTTWLQHIVHQLMRENNYQAGEGKEMCFQSPMIERMGGKFSETIECPRILKTHFNFMNVPKSSEAKYIFCVRNPKDCLTSYYHHNRNFKIYNFADGGFDSFFELFISGQLAFGDYFDHLVGWLPYINNHNVLFLTYEEMCNDLHSAVYRIGQFLGGNAARLVDSVNQLNTIVENSKIGAMKKDQNRWFPENIFFRHQDNFIRKGGSRDWKNYLSKEQSDRLDTVFRTRCAGTVAANWWREEMIWNLSYLQPTKIQVEADSDEGNVDDEEEDDESVSRRNSISRQDRFSMKEHITVPDHPHMVRRASFNSLSTGYGSVW